MALVALLIAAAAAFGGGIVALQNHRLRLRVVHLERAQEVNRNWRDNLGWRVEKLERRERCEPVEEDELATWMVESARKQVFLQ